MHSEWSVTKEQATVLKFKYSTAGIDLQDWKHLKLVEHTEMAAASIIICDDPDCFCGISLVFCETINKIVCVDLLYVCVNINQKWM